MCLRHPASRRCRHRPLIGAESNHQLNWWFMTQKVYNSGTGRFADGLTKAGARIEHYAQHATAFALANQVYENQKMAVKMADSLKNEGINKMSMYGTFFLLQGL